MSSNCKKILILWFFCFTLTQAQNKCPTNCNCFSNDEGNFEVSCTQGGLLDPLPVLQMAKNTQVLRVIPPEGETNALSLGPIFKGLSSLKDIVIIRSSVPAIGEYSFWRLRNLTTINLSHNDISSILETNFKGPKELEKLDLSYNVIESVPSAAFRDLSELTHLDLSHNRMPEVVPQMFLGLNSLQVLDLSYNPFGRIPPKRMSLLPSLKEFSCSGCGLLVIEKHLLDKMPNIEILTLNRNHLTTVPIIRDMQFLHTLILSRNLIEETKGSKLNHFPLKEVNLSHNRLNSMGNETFKNTSLEFVNLSHNKLTNIQSVLEPVIFQLKFIDISANNLQINDIREVISRARELQILNIAYLGLNRLPHKLFRRTRNLRYLNVSFNALSDFPDQILFSTPYLVSLDLSSNKFKGLAQDLVTAFKAMSSLSSIYLDNNPLNCQRCYIIPLVNWLKSSKTARSIWCSEDSENKSCLKCLSPYQFVGRPLISLEVEELEECGTINWIPDDNSPPVNNSGDLELKVASFFKDHMALLVGVGCGLSVALLLVIIVAVACCKKQTALYYPDEPEEEEKKETLLPNANNNDKTELQQSSSSKITDPLRVPPYEPMAISKVLASSKLYKNGNILSPVIVNRIIQEESEPDERKVKKYERPPNFYGSND